MAPYAENSVFRAHAAAVIGHANQGLSAFLHGYMDLRSSGIYRVFDQLFDDACGSFYHLAGRDLVSQNVIEYTYVRCHGPVR